MLTRWGQSWCVCSVKAVWSTPERFRSDAFHLKRYTNVIPLPFYCNVQGQYRREAKAVACDRSWYGVSENFSNRHRLQADTQLPAVSLSDDRREERHGWPARQHSAYHANHRSTSTQMSVPSKCIRLIIVILLFSVKPIQFYCSCLHASILVGQRSHLLAKMFNNNNLALHALANCCKDRITGTVEKYRVDRQLNLVSASEYLVKDYF